MDNVKKLHSGTLYRSNGQIGGDYQLSQHSPAGRSDADTEEAELRHIINMQANEYGVGVDPDYGMYVSSSGGQYNHMGHLTMAPSQKYPHVMSDSMSVGGVVTSAPYHPVPSQPHYPPYYGNQYGSYMGEPQPQYLTQDYGERTHSPGSASSRSASPGGHPQPQPRTVPSPGPPSHPLSCVPSRYDDPSMGHYCQDGMQTAGPGYGYSSGPGYGVSMGHPGGHPSHPPSFKDSQNGLSVGGHSVYGDEDDIAKQMQGMSLAMHCGVLSPSGGPIGLVGQPPDERGALTWRDPNLPEVIGFLNSPSDVVKANAAAYLQHLTFMDDTNKQKTRVLGGIPPLVRLVSSESAEVCRNACGALRNLSYGRQNDENKRTIRDAGGITSLMSLVCRTNDTEVKELITGIIWNMSSCEDLKQSIIDDAAHVIVAQVIIPHSGWHPTSPGDTYWSQVFRNASGVLRNASSAGEYARRRLRCLPGLSESLLHAVRAALAANAITTKIVENCVCVLRNLSYRCQEVEDPLYDSRAPPTSTTSGQPRIQAGASKGENLGCFGGSKKKKEASNASSNSTSPHGGKAGSSEGSLGAPEGSLDGGVGNAPQGGYTVPKGTEMLWSPEVVPLYLALLQSCSNPETLEAAAGALQNLAACYWQPSIDIRAAVRKEKGLPILVELLRMEVDRVVCAVATALRNLAIDQRNKELIGKYAMRDLVQKLPGGNVQHDQGTSDDTIAAVLATLNEVIKKSAEFSRSLLEAGGVDRLIAITKNRQKYTPRVLKFAGAVLATMWSHAELREVYRKHGWREPDFTSAARIVTTSNSNSNTVNRSNVSANRGQASSQGSLASSGPHSPNNANSTLSRPMASQGGTRYEDRTIRRGRPGDEIPMVDINNYQEGGNSNGRPLNQMQQPSR